MSSYRITQSPVPFQSTPSAWRETISTHMVCIISAISIHSLRMEGDITDHVDRIKAALFQSTPSAWRETRNILADGASKGISIHSLRMEGDDGWQDLVGDPPLISIHSLRMEGDPESRQNACRAHGFQSTPSAWRETKFHSIFWGRTDISIHSLRMEGDLFL